MPDYWSFKSPLPYDACVAIKPHACSVWVEVNDRNETRIHIWYAEASVYDVVGSIKTRNPGLKFQVCPLSVGEFSEVRIEHAYYPDGRWTNQDMQVDIPHPHKGVRDV